MQQHAVHAQRIGRSRLSGLANTLPGGGTNGYAISDLNAITESLNGSFEAGTASQYAQDHLVYGACP